MSNVNEQTASGSVAAERRVDLSARLSDSIDLARLMPGQRISKARLAFQLRARLDDVEAVLPAFVGTGLVSIDGDDVLVADLDRSRLMLRMEEREPLETALAHAAASKATASQRQVISGAVLLLKRSAMVGDMEGYMRADRALERLIGEAADLPDSFEKLVQIKREFRRAWCAHNRLRDLNIPAGLRQRLAEAIAAGDAKVAVEAVNQFLNYLRKSY